MRTRFLPVLILLLTLFSCGGSSKEEGQSSPVIYAFHPGRANLNPGTATLLLATFVGGTASIDHGIGPVTSGIPVSVAPAGTTVYTLTVQGAKGEPAVATTTLSVGPMSVDIAPAQMSLAIGQTQAFSAQVVGLADTRIKWSAEGGTIDNAGTFTAGGVPGSYLVGAQSLAEPALCAKAFVTVLATPIAIAISVNPPTAAVTSGKSVTFSAQITGTLNGAVTWSTTAGTITSAGVFTAPPSSGPVTVTATSVADPTKSAKTTIDVVAAPVATSIVAGKSPLTVGTSTTLIPTFSNGTAKIGSTGVGSSDRSASATNGTAVATGTLLVTTTYTLTVTNAAGDIATTTATVTVVAAPVATSLVAAQNSITAGTSTTVTPTFANGTATIGTTGPGSSDLSASATTGVAVPTGNISAATTFTLTVTNAAGDTATATSLVSIIVVITAPAIQGFSSNACSVLMGSSVLLTPTFTGGTASIGTTGPGSSDLTASATSGTAVSSPLLTAAVTYTLTVTGATGLRATQTTTVNVQGFTLTTGGVLATRRTAHDAVRLLDGTVLLVGGQDPSRTGIAQTERYDPATVGFSPAASLSTPRAGATATLLKDGTVLVVGGVTDTFSPTNLALNTAEILDVSGTTAALITWGNSPNLTSGRWGHTATLLGNGRVLIAGGWGDSLKSALATQTELYYPLDSYNLMGRFQSTTGSWATPRTAHAAVLLASGQVLAVGGVDANGLALGTTEVYDPNMDTWTPGPAITARSAPTATLLKDGRVLITGGKNAAGAYVATADILKADLSGLDAAPANAMVTPRSNHQATLLADGKVLITGNDTPTNLAELFDPSSAPGRFAATTKTVEARAGHTATLLADGQIILAAGANAAATNPVYSATGERFQPGSCVTSVLIQPTAPKLLYGDTFTFLASVDSPTGASTVVWSLQEGAAAGTLTTLSAPGNSVSYASTTGPSSATPYHLVATSSGDPTAMASAPAVWGPVVVTLAPTSLLLPTSTYYGSLYRLFSYSITGALDAQSIFTNGLYYTDEPGGEFGDSDGAYYWSGATPTGTGPPYHARVYSLADPSKYGEMLVTVSARPALTFTTTFNGTNWILNHAWVLDSHVSSGSAYITDAAGNVIYADGTVSSGGTQILGPTFPGDSYNLLVTDSAGGFSTASVTNPGFTFSISPSSATVPVGGQVALTITESGVTGTYGGSFAVVEANGGSVLHNGPTSSSYIAPSVAGTYHLIGTSYLNPAITRTATITVTPAITITAPATRVGPGGTLILTHTLVGAPDYRVTWSIAPVTAGAATIDPNGVVSVPATPLAVTYTVTATSIVDATVKGTFQFTVPASSLGGPGTYTSFTSAPNGNVIQGRFGHALTTMPDGLVLVSGGAATATGRPGLSSDLRFNPGSSALNNPIYNPLNFRRDHTATLLPTGKVLLAGGLDANGSVVASCEIFDPTLQTYGSLYAWNLKAARSGHRAELLPNGKVLVVGGVDATGASVDSAELFDAYDQTWTSLGTNPAWARQRHASVRLLDGTVAVFGGGTDGSDTSLTSSVGLFTASTADAAVVTWTALGALPEALGDVTATLTGTGKAVLAGGTTPAGLTQKLQVFDGTTRSFDATPTALLTPARRNILSVYGLDGSVHLLGGFNGLVSTQSHDTFRTPNTLNTLTANPLLPVHEGQARILLLPSGNIWVFGFDTVSSVSPYNSSQQLTYLIP